MKNLCRSTLLMAVLFAMLLAGNVNAQTVGAVDIRNCANEFCTSAPTTPTGPFLDMVIDDGTFWTFANQETAVTGTFEGFAGDPPVPTTLDIEYCGFRTAMEYDPLVVDRPTYAEAANGTNQTGMTYTCAGGNFAGINSGYLTAGCGLLDINPNDSNHAEWYPMLGQSEVTVRWELDDDTNVQVFDILSGAFAAQHQEYCYNAFTDADFNAGDLKIGFVPSADWVDTDGDGYPDDFDNCLNVDNGATDGSFQIDTDLDGYGNACDADYNNDGATTTLDYAIFLAAFQGTTPDLQTDHNGDGETTTLDFSVFLSFFQSGDPAGPSGLSCAGTTPCTPQDL